MAITAEEAGDFASSLTQEGWPVFSLTALQAKAVMMVFSLPD